MSGSFQSHDYVPGVSGWKLNSVSGEFEINSCTLGSAAKVPERQMVSVEVASWSKYDLPKNAANLLQFMQAELQKVPEEYRHAAEFEEFDASYGDDSFNARLFLSYSRLETEEELADRIEKAKVAGTRISIKNGLMTVSHDGAIRFRIGNLAAQEPEHGTAEPFAVPEGKVYVNEAFIMDGSITSKIAANWQVKRELRNGRYVVAGIGLGLDSQFLVSADRFAVKNPSEFEQAQAKGAGAVLELLVGQVTETELGEDLRKEIETIAQKQGAENRAISERLDALKAGVDQLNLERIGEKGNSDGASILLDRRLASIDLRLDNLESNRFRRPNAD